MAGKGKSPWPGMSGFPSPELRESPTETMRRSFNVTCCVTEFVCPLASFTLRVTAYVSSLAKEHRIIEGKTYGSGSVPPTAIWGLHCPPSTVHQYRKSLPDEPVPSNVTFHGLVGQLAP